MKHAFILAIALCAVASACSYREEKTVVPATAPTVATPATVAYVDPPPPTTVVYTNR
jgi:hypothetical protein